MAVYAKSFAKLDAFLKAHKAVFDKMDGGTSPTAKYKLLATVQAIYEMKTRQLRNREDPPSYSKMLDRMSEIPGKLPVPTDVETTSARALIISRIRTRHSRSCSAASKRSYTTRRRRSLRVSLSGSSR